MFMRSRLFMLLILPLAPIAIAKQAYAQKVSLEIGNVYRNGAQTKKSSDGKSQVIAVNHEFRFGSTVAVKLV